MASRKRLEADIDHRASTPNTMQPEQMHSEISESLASETSSAGKPGNYRKILRAIAPLPFVTVCGLAFGFIAGNICLALVLPNAPYTRDYIFYWATGQQLVRHANPYDPVAVTQIERAAGLPPKLNPGLMRNLPWALPLVYPLGFLSLRVGWILWYLLLLACLAVSVHLLWIIYGRPRNRRILLGFPSGRRCSACSTDKPRCSLLLGLVLFLRLHRTRPFLAGISLWLCALKPHLFLPFGSCPAGVGAGFQGLRLSSAQPVPYCYTPKSSIRPPPNRRP